MSQNYVDDEIPEELPESQGGQPWPGIVEELGIVLTPEWMKDRNYKRYDRVPPDKVFVQGIRPLNLKYDTKPGSRTEEEQGDLSQKFIEYRSPTTGEIKTKNSVFGRIKDAYTSLGYNIRTGADAAQVRGKKFLFQTVQEKFSERQTEPSWFTVPVAELPSDYQWTGPVTTRKRGYEGTETAASKEADDLMEKAKAHAAEIVNALQGQPYHMWAMLLSKARLTNFAGAVGNPQRREQFIRVVCDATGAVFKDGVIIK